MSDSDKERIDNEHYVLPPIGITNSITASIKTDDDASEEQFIDADAEADDSFGERSPTLSQRQRQRESLSIYADFSNATRNLPKLAVTNPSCTTLIDSDYIEDTIAASKLWCFMFIVKYDMLVIIIIII